MQRFYDPEKFWVELREVIQKSKLKSVTIIFHKIEDIFLANMYRDFKVEGMI